MLFRLQAACIFMISTRNGLFFASERSERSKIYFPARKIFGVFVIKEISLQKIKKHKRNFLRSERSEQSKNIACLRSEAEQAWVDLVFISQNHQCNKQYPSFTLGFRWGFLYEFFCVTFLRFFSCFLLILIFSLIISFWRLFF
jgi:hypothetical protein